MYNSTVTIQCPNLDCLASNTQNDRFCYQCSTPIVKRYLYAVGEGLNKFEVGSLIVDRYLLIGDSLLLDTKPGVLPQLTEEIPNFILPYLRLLPYRLHVPQVYGFFCLASQEPFWLIEYGSLVSNNHLELPVMPGITEVWPQANPLRQLAWLWQLANLWQPLKNQKVTATLLNSSLLWTNDGIIKILKLESDGQEEPSLQQLGQLWSDWTKNASLYIKDFLQELCLAMIQGQIINSEQLLEILEQGISQCSKFYDYKYNILTASDAGPIREQNEDACYPPPNTVMEKEASKNPIAIVCDGVGGHEGGEIAAQMAIDFLQRELENIDFEQEEVKSKDIILKLENLTCAVNDLISQRNDTENRYEQKQRMGTTLVMAIAHHQDIYFTHVGDSRIYLITPHGYHQISVDDDLASREVRLGYTLYRDTSQYPGAGALVQVLGMTSSNFLYPTVQPLILDEDCLILLCSDGLSDNDRVEQYWQSQILPILEGEGSLEQTVKSLVELANQKNGHDNVTVALVHCQVKSPVTLPKSVLSATALKTILANLPSPTVEIKEAFPENYGEKDPQLLVQDTNTLKSWSKSKAFWLTFVIILGITGLSSWLLVKFTSQRSSSPPPPLTAVSPSVSPAEKILQEGDVFKLNQEVELQSSPNQSLENRDGVAKIPQGSVLKVFPNTDNNSFLLLLQVCYIPEDSSPALIPKGFQGYISSETIKQAVAEIYQETDSEVNLCNSPSPTNN